MAARLRGCLWPTAVAVASREGAEIVTAPLVRRRQEQSRGRGPPSGHAWSARQPFGEVDLDGLADVFCDGVAQIGLDWELVGAVAECHE